MKNYKYIFAIGFLVLGIIIGGFIGWFLMFLLLSLFNLFGIEGFSGSGIGGLIAFFLPLILGAISFSLPIIGAIRGWKHGYKTGKKKDETIS